MDTTPSLQPQPSEQGSDGGICVFAPSPLYTVTLENATDKESEVHFHAGGQGFWVARMATRLGVPTTLCGPFGGESGKVLKMLIESENVNVRAVVSHDSNGGYIHDRREGQRKVIATVRSARLTRHEIDDLYNAVLTCSLDIGVAVLTGPAHEGVVPPDIYRRLARDLGTNGASVVADLSEEALASAVEGGLYFLKVSDREFLEAGYANGDTVEQIIEGMKRLREKGVQNIIVSRANAATLALIDRHFFEIVSPHFESMEHRGAGDSMTAALAVGIATGMDIESTLRLAVAAGALNVTRHGLGTGWRQNIEDIAKHIEVRALPI